VFRLFLASRYMLARPVSYLAMCAIAVAVMALITVISVMNGFLMETRDIVRGTTADIIVLPRQDPGRGYAASRERFEAVVTAHPDVAGVCARFVRPAVVKVHGAPDMTLGDSLFSSLNQVLVLGIDADAEAPVTDLRKYLEPVDGKDNHDIAVTDPLRPFFLDRRQITDGALRNAGLPYALVGEPRMRQLGLVRGDALEMVTVPEGTAVQGESIRATTQTFVISGTFETGKHDFDTATVFVPRDAFRAWTGTQQEFSELYVRCRDGADLEHVRDELRSAFRDARLPASVETWMDRHSVYLGAVENERNILAFVLSLFVLLTCTITFSMLTMMVQEKVRDIGILSAMGASAGGIGAVFALCGLYVAGLGGALGLLLGELLSRHINDVKDWIESTFGIQVFNRDVYAFTEIPTSIHQDLNVAIVVGTACFSVFICLLPALRAARMDPVEALRHE
jgi:lipoprotein-releasing system permease protein